MTNEQDKTLGHNPEPDPNGVDSKFAAIPEDQDLEKYGVWVKSGPEDYSEPLFAEKEIDLQDLEGEDEERTHLTEEEETLLGDLEHKSDYEEEFEVPEMDIDSDLEELNIESAPEEDMPEEPEVFEEDLFDLGEEFEEQSEDELPSFEEEELIEIPLEDKPEPEEEPFDFEETTLPTAEEGLEDIDLTELQTSELGEDLPELELDESFEEGGETGMAEEDEFSFPEESFTDEPMLESTEAEEDELIEHTSPARDNTPFPAESSRILTKIEEELLSIKNELSSLKTELSSLKAADAQEVQHKPSGEEEGEAGFFVEEEDETIALTGDELDNILNTAEFTEEVGKATAAPDEDIVSDETLTGDELDNILSTAAITEAEAAGEAVEEVEEEADLESLPDLYELEDADEGDFEIDEDNLPDLSEPEPIIEGEDIIPELGEEELPEDVEETLEAPESSQRREGEGAVHAIPENELIDEIEVSIPEQEEEPDLLETPEDLELTEDELEDIQVETDEDYDFIAEHEEALADEFPVAEGGEEETAEESVDILEDLDDLDEFDIELEAGEPQLSISEPEEVEEISLEPEEEEMPLDLDLEEELPDEDDITIDIEEPDLEELEMELPEAEEPEMDFPEVDLTEIEEPETEKPEVEEPEVTLEAPEFTTADLEDEFGAESPSHEVEQLDTELPEDLKTEIKSVLSYMDQLLESLPEDKIREFAESEHFEVYKKLFEELGLKS